MFKPSVKILTTSRLKIGQCFLLLEQRVKSVRSSNLLRVFLALVFSAIYSSTSYAQLISTPYAEPGCSANDANISAAATNTFNLNAQCALPTDTATIEYNITYTQNASKRYDLIMGVVYNNELIYHDFFEDIRTGGANDFVDLDGEMDHGDYSSTPGSDVIVQIDLPCDLDGDGAVDASPTIEFAMGYNAAKSGSGSPQLIEGPKCALSNPITFPLSTTLQIVKSVVNDNGGSSTVSDFGITTSAGSLTFDGGTTSGSTTTYTSNQILALSPGTYSLSELDLGNYTEGTWFCTQGVLNNSSASAGSITIANGEQPVCMITNDDTGPATTATLTLVKAVTNDDGGSATPDAWTLAYSDGGSEAGSGLTGSPAVTSVSVQAGNYTLTETDGPSGYTLDSLVCSGGSDADGIDGLTLLAGENVTCTFANNDNAVVAAPEWTVTKVASNDTNVAVGDVITYTYEVTNTGNVDLTDVSISDVHGGAGTLGAVTPASVATLTPMSVATFTADYTVTQADIDAGGTIDNTATANATPVSGTFTAPTADESISLTAPQPEALFSKIASPDADVDVGDVVTYTYTVQNTGNVTLNNVTISDVHGGSGTLSAITPASASVAPGTSQDFTATYTVTQADVDAATDISNTATMTSEPAQGTLADIDATETVGVIYVPSADLVTVKTLASGNTTPRIGDVVSFDITVTNNGPDDTTNVSLTDILPAGLIATANNGTVTAGSYNDVSGNWTIATLANGATATLTLEGTVDLAAAGTTITNITTAATSDVPDSDTAGDVLEASVDVLEAAPESTLTKTASNDTDVAVGDVITYTYVFTNTGNVSLNNVSITDVHSGTGTLGAITPASVATVAVGDSATFTADYTVTQADIDAGTAITNTATSAATPAGGTYTPVTADESISPETAAPAATLVKTPSNDTDVVVGEVITYT